MGLEWVFLVKGDTGSYCIIIWIISYCWMDHIVSSAGSYRISWIGSYRISWIRKNWLLCAGWLLSGWDGWDGWTGWGIGGTGVGRTDVSTRRNGSSAMGSVTGVPPLALEGRRAVGSGGWHQLRRCYKDAKYLCRISKIIQIQCTKIGTNTWYKIVKRVHTIQLYYGCTQIRTSNLVQYSIDNTYNKIVLSLNRRIQVCAYLNKFFRRSDEI